MPLRSVDIELEALRRDAPVGMRALLVPAQNIVHRQIGADDVVLPLTLGQRLALGFGLARRPAYPDQLMGRIWYCVAARRVIPARLAFWFNAGSDGAPQSGGTATADVVARRAPADPAVPPLLSSAPPEVPPFAPRIQAHFSAR
ncbi:MAG: hypothetical protein ABIQ29_03205 [Burkholderiaceae bacterium]